MSDEHIVGIPSTKPEKVSVPPRNLAYSLPEDTMMKKLVCDKMFSMIVITSELILGSFNSGSTVLVSDPFSADAGEVRCLPGRSIEEAERRTAHAGRP